MSARPITRAQREALHRLWLRSRSGDRPHGWTYRQFRRTVAQGYDCLMVQLWNMWIGIETDGYTHT